MRRARLPGPPGSLERGCTAGLPAVCTALPSCLTLPAPPATPVRFCGTELGSRVPLHRTLDWEQRRRSAFYHCLIHQTVLCATLSEQFAEEMNTMMKLINFLRASSSLQHRLLREFLEDVEANANDLLLHNNVRWLSKGNSLGRFWSIRKEITAFLKQVRSKRATEFLLFLQDEHKMDVVAFWLTVHHILMNST